MKIIHMASRVSSGCVPAAFGRAVVVAALSAALALAPRARAQPAAGEGDTSDTPRRKQSWSTLPQGPSEATIAPRDAGDARRTEKLRGDLASWVRKLADLPSSRCVLLAQAGGPMRGNPSRVVRVPAATQPDWPEDVLIAYVILLDSNGRPRFVREVPVSASGDWYIEDDWLFAASGNTLAVRRHRSTYAADCEELPARESWAVFYDGRRLLARDQELTDAKGVKQPPERCQLMLAPQDIDATLDDFLGRRGLASAFRDAGIFKSAPPAPAVGAAPQPSR